MCLDFDITRILYWVSPKKRGTAEFRYNPNVLCALASLDKTSSEKDDTKIIEFGWVVLIQWSFLETQSFSNFVSCAWAKGREIHSLWPSIVSLFCLHGSMARNHWSLCRRIWISDWLIEVTPPGRHDTTRNNHSTNAVFRLFVYSFSIVILVTNLPENSCMCSCELQKRQLKGWGRSFHPWIRL